MSGWHHDPTGRRGCLDPGPHEHRAFVTSHAPAHHDPTKDPSGLLHGYSSGSSHAAPAKPVGHAHAPDVRSQTPPRRHGEAHGVFGTIAIGDRGRITNGSAARKEAKPAPKTESEEGAGDRESSEEAPCLPPSGWRNPRSGWCVAGAIGRGGRAGGSGGSRASESRDGGGASAIHSRVTAFHRWWTRGALSSITTPASPPPRGRPRRRVARTCIRIVASSS